MDAATLIDHRARQRIDDARDRLDVVRRAALARPPVDGGDTYREVQIITGGARLNDWMMARSQSWQSLLSVRAETSAHQLERSLPNNRRRTADGLRMTSTFDRAGTEPAARALLGREPGGYRYAAHAPLDMRLVDEREVFLHGPSVLGEPTLLRLRTREALHAAWAYWHAVEAATTRCEPTPVGTLTARQRTILGLLGRDLTDERIAERLQVCVRTVRTDIAAAMRTLGAHSRFSAGVAYASLDADPLAG